MDNALDLRESWYNATANQHLLERSMSDNTNEERDSDGMADAGATIAIITITVVAVCIWLSGMPS